jgi:hypothetical protein
MRARNDLGATSFWLLLIVALVAGGLVVVPFAVAGHQEASHDQEAIAQIDRARDVSAQATLQTAVRGASAYFAENATFVGFDPQAASQFDPSIRYTTGAPTASMVSIRGVTPTSVVLVTSTGSAHLCAAVSAGVVSFGRADAATAAACTGGW